jgi:PKD repeat protein
MTTRPTLGNVVTDLRALASRESTLAGDVRALKAAHVRTTQRLAELNPISSEYAESLANQTLLIQTTRTQVELENAINRAYDSGEDGATVYIREGVTELTSTLRMAGIRHLTIVGQGATLRWAGPDDVPAIEFDQTQLCKLVDVRLLPVAGIPLMEALRTTDTRTNNGSHAKSQNNLRSEGLILERFMADARLPGTVMLGGWNNKLGSAFDAKNDQHIGYTVKIFGATDYSINVEGQAARNITLFDPRLQGHKIGDPSHRNARGIRSTEIPGHGGSCHVYGGIIMNNTIDIDIGDRSGPWGFYDTWFEQSYSWIRALDYRHLDGAQREYLQLIVQACKWGAKVGEVVNPIIDLRVAGASFRQCEIGKLDEDQDYEIHVEPAFDHSEAFEWLGGEISGTRSNPNSIFTGRYPSSTRGSRYHQGGLASGSMPLTKRRDNGWFVPAFEEDIYGKGLRKPRAFHAFEEKTIRPAWTADTVYAQNDEVSNANRSYICVTGGTSDSSGGPTSKGSAITDNTVTWKFKKEGTGTVYDRQLSGAEQLHLLAMGGASLRYADANFEGYCGRIPETADAQFALYDDLEKLNPNDRSVLYVALVHVENVGAANRMLLTIGDGVFTAGATGPSLRFDASGNLEIVVNGNVTTGADVLAGEVFVIGALWDRNLGTDGRITVGVLLADGTYLTELTDDATGPVGNLVRKGWGASSSGRTPPLMSIREDAVFSDEEAESFGGAPTLEALLRRYLPRATVAAPPPVASFTYDDNDLSVDFTDTSTPTAPATIASRDWDFGDGATSTSATPTHAYAAAGEYDVRLTVTDSNGKIGETIETVTVRAVIAPTALTTASNATNQTTYSGGTGPASITPTAGRFHVAVVLASHATAAEIPTVTGNDLDWSLLKDLDENEATILFATDTRRVSVFGAMGTPTTGAPSISFTTLHTGCAWAFLEFDLTDQDFDEIAEVFDAVVQVVVLALGAPDTTILSTLAAFEHANNRHFYACATDQSAGITVGTGFTQHGEASVASGDLLRLEVASRRNDTEANPTFASAVAAIVGIEIKSRGA